MKNLTNKLVLVTGAAMGLGRLHALHFAAEGARVILADVREDLLSKTEMELRERGATVYSFHLDVSNRSDCFALADRIAHEIGTVDVLVNNAGIFKAGEMLTYPEDALRRQIEVNQLGMVWMMQAFLPGMLKQQSGHVVNICSVAGKVGVSYMGPYSGTKAAVILMTDSFRNELYGKGIGFTIVNPYFVSTGMFEGGKPLPLSRYQSPEKVARAVVRAVKKNRGEVNIPDYAVRSIAIARSLGFPNLLTFIMRVLGERNIMGHWKEDKKRAF